MNMFLNPQTDVAYTQMYMSFMDVHCVGLRSRKAVIGVSRSRGPS